MKRHETSLTAFAAGLGGEWQAKCTCGWKGQKRVGVRSYAYALNDTDDHMIDMKEADK